MIKKFAFLLFAMLSICINAQLAAFTVTASKVNDETCASNGAISWTTANTTSGSTITYKVINTANNSTVAALSGTTYTSLVAGTYKIEATQTSGTLSNKATSNTITIANSIKPLAYTLNLDSNEICGNDGQVTVKVSTGNGPFQYQIINPSTGSVLVSQSSNVFSGLTAGDKYVRVTDACGNGIVQKITIFKNPSQVNSIQIIAGTTTDCQTVTYDYVGFGYDNTINKLKLPVKIEVTYTNPVTSVQETITKTYDNWGGSGQGSGSDYFQIFNDFSMPFFPTVSSLPSKILVTDGCGKSYDFNYNFDYSFKPFINLGNSICGSQYMFIGSSESPGVGSPIKINYISGPAGFDPRTVESDYDTFKKSHVWGSGKSPLPAGEYTVEVESLCGQKVTQKTTINKVQPVFSTEIFPTCDSKFGAFRNFLSNYYEFKTIKIIAAPANYSQSLPYDITNLLTSLNPSTNTSKTLIYLDNLPAGTYTFEYTVTCDNDIRTFSVTIPPTVRENTTVTIANIDCQSFTYNYNLSLGSGYSQNETVYLQRYYPATDSWSAVDNYTAPTATNPYPGTLQFYAVNKNGTASINNLPPAKYRFIVSYQAAFTNENRRNCYIVLSNVDLDAQLVLSNAYAFKCSDGSYNVAVVASKVAGAILKYAIMSDGSPTATVVRDNGNNPIFNGLQYGSYYFRVTDDCGNYTVRKLDIAALGQPGIRTIFDCSTTPGSVKLVVDGLENLSYEWTKEGSPTVLSTTNILDLGTYDASKAGKYFVRIYSTDAAYCINKTYETTLSDDALANPKSGIPVQPQPTPVSYDGSIFTVDLFKYLQPDTYDGFGTWTEISTPASNTLDGSQWNIYAAKDGLYTFRYTVKSPCGIAVNYTDVTLRLSKLCYKSPINTRTIEDTKFGITSLGRAGKDKDNWPMLRKGGWMALESNTKGFVVNRLEFNSSNQPIGIPASNYVEGMMVYDTTNKCLKIYNGTAWSCFNNPACPD